MSNNNKKKAEQLGMPFGTAAGRLRKELLYKYVKAAGDHICYRCNEPIDSVEEFSIDHKIDWLDENPDLFWDLDNIAFSHHPQCNKRRPSRKEGPEGTAWCRVHEEFLPIENFSPAESRWSGVRSDCRECAASHYRENRHRYYKDQSKLVHGTVSGYSNYKCRCEDCKKAQSDYVRNKI